MTQSEISFESVDRFVAGTVGEPGERAFYLQVRDSTRLLTFAVEKSQVAAVAERMSYLLREIRLSQPLNSFKSLVPDAAPLEMPIDEEFSIGEIGISYNEASELIEIELLELTETEEEERTLVSIKLSLSQADAFVKRSNFLVAAGRASCPFCGGPINRNGHLCPRANGYRR